MLACHNPSLIYPIVGGRPRHWKWQATAKDFILNYEGRCRACHTINNLQVHHKTPYNQAPELELVRANLMTGCANCHFVIYHANDWSSWVKDVEGEANRHLRLVLSCKEMTEHWIVSPPMRPTLMQTIKELFSGQ